MNERFYRPARLDMRAWGVTALVGVLMLYIAFFTDGPLVTRLLIPLLLLALAGLFVIRGYAIEADAVVVKHYIWQRRFPLADLQDAMLDPGAVVGSIRTFGIGGFFGYIGRFHNRQLGGYLAYVTDGSHAVVLRFPDRTLVLSPADPTAFLTHLQATAQLA